MHTAYIPFIVALFVSLVSGLDCYGKPCYTPACYSCAEAGPGESASMSYFSYRGIYSCRYTGSIRYSDGTSVSTVTGLCYYNTDTGKLSAKDSHGIQDSDKACPSQAPQDATCLADKKAQEKQKQKEENETLLSQTINALCKGIFSFGCPRRPGDDQPGNFPL